MSEVEWLRFAPFLLCGFVLLEEAVLIWLQTDHDKWDLLNVSIVLIGVSVALYLGSLAATFAGWVNPPTVYWDAVRIAMGVASLLGLYPLTRQIARVLRYGKDGYR